MIKNIYQGKGFKTTYFLLPIFLFTSAVMLMVSCKVTKPSAYFTNLKKDTTLSGVITNDFELKIMKGDRLSISVSSLSSVEDAFFNSAGSVGANISGSTATGGYSVQQDGTITLHRLGNVLAAGITRKELSLLLQQKLLTYMKEPIVQVNFLNHKITVMGEVRTPQIIPMPDEPLTVIEALILSGDVSPNAKRNDVAIIRQQGSEKKVKHINLEDNSIFSSPWYYLQPNDIVLVSADTDRYVKEENRKKIQTSLSLVASGISLLIIIADRIIK